MPRALSTRCQRHLAPIAKLSLVQRARGAELWLQQTARQVAGRCLSAISLGVRICEDAADSPVAQGGGLHC